MVKVIILSVLLMCIARADGPAVRFRWIPPMQPSGELVLGEFGEQLLGEFGEPLKGQP